jgi:predicted transcriptional regulator
MEGLDMEHLCDLYFELSNEDRLEILQKLREDAMNVTGLARELSITTQECSRHLARLSEAKLVERGPDGSYSLSQYGRLSLRLIAGQSFVSEHRDYFTNHTLEWLPPELVSRIGELQAGKSANNVMVMFSQVENIIREAQENLLFIHDQYLPSILPLGVEAMKRGITSSSVELKVKAPGRNLNPIRPDYITLEDEEYFIQVWNEGRIKPRYTEEVHVFLYLNEKEALIAFPFTEGGFDYLGFSSDDPAFHKYCMDVFNYYFKTAEPPSQERMDMAIERLNFYKKDEE